MCGINGIYNHLSLNDSKSQVIEMNQLSAHRGPDNQGIYEDEDVVLGHVRLSIIDLDPRSHQPFISDNQQIILSFNGEIYNFQELKKELKEYNFVTHSDTEVIVAAYLKWGLNFLDRLDGMFAFCLWDKAEKQLILARDKMGIKPLYYFENNNTIGFSSEIRSLLSCTFVDRKLSQTSLQDYLQYSTVHGPNTIVNGVKLLPAGCYLKVKEDEIAINSYWDIRDNYVVNSSNESLDEIESNVSALFNKAVQKRLVSDVSYGAFLSGGID
jgi:asparagine synthase (glutamine-hydrolysing)